jgi:tetratricopeptide (TPR) repeat protein
MSDNISENYSMAAQNLTAAIAKKDTEAMRQSVKKMLDCARALKLPYLEISAFCIAARGYLSVGQQATAFKLYDEAAKIAKEQETSETNSELYKLLSVQVLIYKGAFLLTQKSPQYNGIIEIYQQAADKLDLTIAEKGKSEAADWTNSDAFYFYLYESLRVMGYCQEQLGRQQAALKHYVKAISAAEKLSPDLRKSTPIPIVGKALLNLCRKLGMKKEYFVVIDKINGILGEGWEKEAPKK